MDVKRLSCSSALAVAACSFVVGAALGLSACGDDEPRDAAAPTVPAWDTTPPARTRVTARVEPSTKSGVTGPFVGRWRAGDGSAGSAALELRGDGTYLTSDVRDGVLRGYYRARGRTLIFGTDEGCAEGGYAGRGTYSWSLDAGRLRITRAGPEEGGCTGRAQLLAGRAWKRVR